MVDLHTDKQAHTHAHTHTHVYSPWCVAISSGLSSFITPSLRLYSPAGLRWVPCVTHTHTHTTHTTHTYTYTYTQAYAGHVLD